MSMRRATRHLDLLASLLTVLTVVAYPASIGAQSVRVQIVDDRTAEPIAGAIVSLLDARGTSVDEGLTSSTGHRLLTATASGEHRILVRRVGYVPVTSPPISLASGRPLPYVLPVRGQRVVLPSVVSRVRRGCRAQVDEVARTAVLWEEIRKALTASELTREEAYNPIQLRVVERTLDTEGHTLSEAWSPWTTTRQSPFVATSPAELSRSGYLLREDGKPVDFRASDVAEAQLQWHGPDAMVLLSSEFERDHCFQVVAGSGATQGLIGLAFEPIEGRKLPDIAGTLWVDRETAELRHVEFEYVNTGLPSRVNRGGGRIEFERLPTGEWIVREWTLRYPRIVLGRRSRDFSLSGLSEVGGQAGPARMGRLAGTIYDSLAHDVLRGARLSVMDSGPSVTTGADGHYLFDSLEPGLHRLLLSHPALDSLGVGRVPVEALVVPEQLTTRDVAIPSHRSFRAACTTPPRTVPDSGMIAGTVYDTDGSVIARATIVLSWMSHAPADTTAAAPTIVARSDERGSWIACGLPVGTPIVARVEANGRASAETLVTIGARAIARQDLVLLPPPPGLDESRPVPETRTPRAPAIRRSSLVLIGSHAPSIVRPVLPAAPPRRMRDDVTP